MEVHTIHLKTVNSTSTFAKEHAAKFDPKKITCVVADEQTGGRGRTLQRHWISPKGNLFFSLFFCLEFGDPLLPNLAQLIAFSACQFLRTQNVPVQLKWPNDLFLNEKKLGGTLVETTQVHQKTGVVIGLGLNVNTPIETTQPTISLFETTKKTWGLTFIREQVIDRFQKDLEKGFFPREFEKLLVFKNEPITCNTGKETLEGVFIGINELGHLKLKKNDGSVLTFASGDIFRIRKDC